MCHSETHPHKGKAHGQVSTKTSLCWSTSWRKARLWITGTRKLRVEHRSHREEARELHLPGCRGAVQLRGSTQTSRSLRSTTLQIVSRNIENAVARKEKWNRGWYEGWRLRAFEQRFQSSKSVRILNFNTWQSVHYRDIDLFTLTSFLLFRFFLLFLSSCFFLLFFSLFFSRFVFFFVSWFVSSSFSLPFVFLYLYDSFLLCCVFLFLFLLCGFLSLCPSVVKLTTVKHVAAKAVKTWFVHIIAADVDPGHSRSEQSGPQPALDPSPTTELLWTRLGTSMFFYRHVTSWLWDMWVTSLRQATHWTHTPHHVLRNVCPKPRNALSSTDVVATVLTVSTKRVVQAEERPPKRGCLLLRWSGPERSWRSLGSNDAVSSSGHIL